MCIYTIPGKQVVQPIMQQCTGQHWKYVGLGSRSSGRSQDRVLHRINSINNKIIDLQHLDIHLGALRHTCLVVLRD